MRSFARYLPVAVALAAACSPPIPKYQLRLPELHARLDNGMRLIVLPDPSTDLVEVDVRYEVGSNEDPPGKAGLAHLVEHLMFQQRPAGPDRPPLGAVLRQLSVYYNAYTIWDATHYQVLAKAAALESVISIEAARLATGCQSIDQATFEREREVVRNEIRLRLGSPEAQAMYLLLEDIYPEGHAYRRMPGGDDEQLAAITLDDVCRFMSDYYVPERATMIVAGKVTEADASRLGARWLAALPARKPAPRRTVEPIKLARKTFTHELDVEETSVFVSWKLPPEYTAEGQAAQFMVGSLAGSVGMFGESYEFATDVGVELLGGPLAPVFVLQVSLKDAGKVDEALEFIWKAARSAHRPFEEGDNFEKTRKRMIGRLAMAFESLSARTNMFGEHAQFDPSGRFFRGELERIGAISGGRVRAVTKATLDPDQAVVVVVKSKPNGQGKYKRAKLAYGGGTGDDKSREDFEVDPAEAKLPVAVPEQPTMIGRARRFQLANGMKVVLLPTGAVSLPVVTARLMFAVGSAHEPRGMAGLAGIAAQALMPPGADMGISGELDSANVLGQVGAQFSADAGQDSTTFTARGLDIYLEVLVRGLERLVKAGDYDQEGLEAQRRHFAHMLHRRSYKGMLAFERLLVDTLYGAEHPYGTGGIATPESLAKIGRDEAFAFKQAHYTARNATLVVAGSFDEKLAERIIRGSFGEWAAGGADTPVASAAPVRTAPAAIGVVGEDLPMLDVRIAYPGAMGIDPHHAARLVLGEMLSQRLAAVRERLGASYGIHARYETNLGPGAYVAGGGVDAERAGEALRAMRDGVEALRRGEGFDEDFARARRVVLQRLLGGATDSMTLAWQLATIEEHSLAGDFFDQLVREVARLPTAEVKALIEAELKPEREIVLGLGAKPALEKAFAGAGLAGARIVE